MNTEELGQSLCSDGIWQSLEPKFSIFIVEVNANGSFSVLGGCFEGAMLKCEERRKMENAKEEMTDNPDDPRNIWQACKVGPKKQF